MSGQTTQQHRWAWALWSYGGRVSIVALLGLVCLLGFMGTASAQTSHLRAKWSPLHFKPAIETATDEQCLACHQAVLTDQPRTSSPAGVKSAQSLAWYQTLDTYQGEQESFHRRHLVTPMAKQLMNLKCTTCHQGSDPKEQSPSATDTSGSFTLRKTVNPETCHMCHGQFNFTVMNLPAQWTKVRDGFNNNCLLCHAAIRTERHKVNFLKAAAIEEAGKKSGDVCFGCHGGRAWYRTPFPMPRHPWPGMDTVIPEWAKNRPTQSLSRFLPVSEGAATPASAPAATKEIKK
jgi:nitrate/TMAO reductase-like tetraheme cytochrome c subunit